MALIFPGRTEAAAAPRVADLCISAVHTALAREQRIYRTVILGLPHAKDVPPGSSRYDKEGRAWIKMKINDWRSEDLPNENRADEEMDTNAERDPLRATPFRRGILETKKVLTSELIPPMTQSIRALRCRVEAVCEAVFQSVPKSGLPATTTFPVHTHGCIPFTMPIIPACQLGIAADPDEYKAVPLDQIFLRTYCRQVGADLLRREADVLKLLVSYDAAYRSLLQFAGHFDLFMKEFRSSLATPVRQAVSLLGQLNRIPCFLSQCDE